MSGIRAPSPPGPDDVDLWTVGLDLPGDRLARAVAVLSAAERERFTRVIRPRQRDRLIVARGALRRVLGAYLGLEPEAVAFARDPRGKPRLHPDARLAFNLSHSGALAVVAVTARPAVGVDIELLGRRIRPGVLLRALAASERPGVLALDGAERDEAFLRHWTAKEAYAKALGVGLSIGMDRVEITGAAAGEPALADPGARARFTLGRFDPAPGAVGTVAVAGGPWRARVRRL